MLTRQGELTLQRLGAALLALLCGMTAAQAQEPVQTIPVQTLPEPPASAATEQAVEVQLEKIVVTGEKQNRSADQTNASVAVKTGRQIETYGDTSVEDVLRRTGNAIASENGQFSLRGINSTGSESGEFGTPVASIYVDGVVLDRIGQQFGAADLFDVEQVEVLRGPQSTSQGRNALAGAVVVRTRDPSANADVRFKALAAGRNIQSGAIALGLPLSDFEDGEGLGSRLVFEQRMDDGYIPNITRGEEDWQGSDTQAGRVKLKAAQGRYTGLATLAQTLNAQGPDINFEREGAFGTRTAEANDLSRNRGRTRSVSVENGFALSETFGLQFNVAALRSLQDTVRDFDQSRVAASTLVQTADNNSGTGELRFTVKDWRGLSGFVGLFVGHFEADSPSRVRGMRIPANDFIPSPGAVLPPPLDMLPRIDDPTASYLDIDFDARFANEGRNRAIFTEFDWLILPRLTLTAGLRYDTEKTEAQAPFSITRADLVACTGSTSNCAPGVDVRDALAMTGAFPEAGAQTAVGDFNALLPKLAARWQFTPQINAGFTYSEGYRSGGAEVLFSTGQINSFDPEYTRNYELSLRGDFFKRRLGVAFNAYYVDWRDQQVAVRTADGNDSMIVNAAKSRLQGAEIELTARPIRALTFYVSAGYADTEYLDYQNSGVDFSGNAFTKAPPFTGSAGAALRLPFGFSTVVNVSHSDAYFTEPDNNSGSRTNAYTVLDARLAYTYKPAGLTLTAFGKNLSDASYSTYRFPVEATGGRDAPGQFVSYGAPRTLGVQIEGRF